MKKLPLCFLPVFLLLSVCTWAADLKKPARTPTELTAEQKALLHEGIALHDQGDYDGAIRKYESILESNPDGISAIYELSFSYFAKKDYRKSLEFTEKGTGYISDILPRFYMQMASCLDHLGESEKAIDIYKETLEKYPREPLLHFNLALTYSQNKKPDLAISHLKEELYISPEHPTSHLLLGLTFQESGYQIPAIFALSRFLILEPMSSRASQVLLRLRQLINVGVVVKDEKTININVDPDAKKDEGDFASLQMALSLVSAGRFLEENKNKSPVEKEVEQFRSFFKIMMEMIGEDKNKLKFTGNYYVPYFIELQKQGYVDAFVYLIHASSSEQEIKDWLEQNMDKVLTFMKWSEQYQWPGKNDD